ncbi:methylesterase 10-like protein [Tanacetum coccineum]
MIIEKEKPTAPFGLKTRNNFGGRFHRNSEDPKNGNDQARDTFLITFSTCTNERAKKWLEGAKTKNMLTGKWTPMNRDVQKFNSIYDQTKLLSGENEDDMFARVLIFFKDQTGREFTHRSAWLFLKNKFKWKNPESTQARRSRGRVTEEEEPEMFGADAIPRPPGAPRKAKVQRSSSSTSATSGSQKEQFTELMQTQINLDREAKKEHMERELAARLAVCEIQKRNEELKILTFDTTGMNPADAAKIEALKDAARAKYFTF